MDSEKFSSKITVIDITEIRNNLFKISFSNGFKGNLYKGFFPYFGLYRGKQCSKEEFINVTIFMRLKRQILYAISLIKRRIYSKAQLREKLKKVKNLTNYEIDLVISFLKEELDFKESNSISCLITELNERNFSNSAIKKKLVEKKFNFKFIKCLDISSPEIERRKCFNIGEKYFIKIKNKYSHDNLICHLYNYLIGKGFDYKIINDVIDELLR